MTPAEFVYTVLLKPRPLRFATNAVIRALLPRVVRYGPAKIVLNPRDPVISGALTFRVYERSELAFFRKTLGPGMTLLDIGANVGLYSAIGSHAVGEGGRVLAFEPDPENFQYLTETMAANPYRNAALFQFAGARQAGTIRLFTSSSNRGDNRLYENDLSDASVEVQAVKLDDFLSTIGVRNVDFIKIDVQGFEGHVLEGLAQTIQNSPRVVLLTEFWPSGLQQAGTDPKRFLELLEGFGLSLSELISGGQTTQLDNKDSLIQRHQGRRYTNVVGIKR